MIITEATIICIIILFMIIWLVLFCAICNVSKKLKSIETDLMSLETRQRTIFRKLEYIHTSIYYVSSIVDKIDEKSTNENNERTGT
jgi:hypothetical protein